VHHRVGVDGHDDVAARGGYSGIASRRDVPVFVAHHDRAGSFRDRLRSVAATVGDHNDLGTRASMRDRLLDGVEPSLEQHLFVASRDDDREPRTWSHGELSAMSVSI